MPWVHFEYDSVASRSHSRDECTASAVGGTSSGNGSANGVPLRNEIPCRA